SRGYSESRVQEVSEITRALKAIARELNIPVLALSQLSRATEARTPAIPKLVDLRESGTIEQDADVVMFIYRKVMDKGIRECSPEERNIAEIYIAKHRNGPLGIIKLYFEENKASFRTLEKTLEEETPF
ncbi:MAG: replicative DNA helicase, partial [Parcubacteria group bacterium CG_4_10_14_0_8_um_filter_35_7]